MNGLTIYSEFYNRILSKQRFFFDKEDPLLKTISKYASQMEEVLNKDSTVYRSRIMTDDMMFEDSKNDDSNFPVLNKKEIGAPPSHCANAGRLNPEHISYLYVSNTPICSISELRPAIKTLVAVGKGNINRDVKCLSFLRCPQECDEKYELQALQATIWQFGTVVNNPIEYTATQVIAEFIKEIGYQGIVYPSSQTKDKINYLLFDPEACDFVSTSSYSIENISYQAQWLCGDGEETLNS